MQKITGSTLGYLKHDTVEEHAVIASALHLPQEIIAVCGRFVVKFDDDVACGGIKRHLRSAGFG